VFPSQSGTVLNMNNFIKRTFVPLVQRAGQRKMRFHDLRHRFGRLLIQQVASLAYVKEQMGHSSIQVTVDTDGHLVLGGNIEWVDRLDDGISPQESATPAQPAPSAAGDEMLQVLGYEWLGGRDSNPDRQIQSLSAPPDSKGNQQANSANPGKVRQNPQHSRNKNKLREAPLGGEAENPNPRHHE